MPNKKSLYVSFQGLFLALLILFLFIYRGSSGPRLLFGGMILSWGAGALIATALVSSEELDTWSFQAALFVGDMLSSSVLLLQNAGGTDLELVYLFIVLGTVIASRWTQTLLIGLIAEALYVVVGLKSGLNLSSVDFWLRFDFMATATALMGLISFNARRGEEAGKMRLVEHAAQEERLGALAETTAELAHRVKGPLSNILVNADILSKRLGSGKTAELDEIREEVRRCQTTLSRLIDLGRRERLQPRPFDLVECVNRVMKAVEPQMKAKELRGAISGNAQRAPVIGDAELIEEALLILVRNAIDAACPEFGRIGVAVSRARPAVFSRELAGPSVAVEDDGRGIAAEDMKRLFTPFFTTKDGGSGLGLWLAWRIAQKHGASLSAQSAGRGKGSRFTLSFPAADQSKTERGAENS